MNPSYQRRTVDRREIGVPIGFVLLCELVGILGALATAPAIETWYATIAKPGFHPAVVGLRTGLDASIFPHRRRGLSRLAAAR